jgi:hypothetical protein
MKLDHGIKFGRYVLDNLMSNFLGFFVGFSSARLVSHFFATRSIKNLWGLTSHKTLVTKTTYTNLEWFVSVVVGFIVFEVVSKWLKEYVATAEWVKKMKASFAHQNASAETAQGG